MSFLDSLENNLKTLESREDTAERDQQERRRRESERAAAQAAAPFAERLKNSPFTAELLNEAIRIGHTQRTKVHMAWLGTTLRLEAKTRRLELRPTADGVVAAFFDNDEQLRNETVDLAGDGTLLAKEWLQASAL
ncbi:MAG: hypothetical protein JO022_15190 [Acidobacteriaceae bacterium]|nr:hypothetical protein [Acidobacteriaceae bacterium]